MKVARRPSSNLIEPAMSGLQVLWPADQVIHARWQHETRGLIAVPDKSIDHVLTDPPYSEYVHSRKWSGGNKATGPQAKQVTFKPLSAEELQQAAQHIVRTTRGWALVFCCDDDIHSWRDALVAAGATRGVTIVWTKPNATPQFRGEGPSQAAEYIVTSWCGEGRPRWNGGGKIGHYAIPVESIDRTHETQKPIRLITNLVIDFTQPGDLIADPYGGSGTLGVACKRTGRHYAIWEEDEKHAVQSAARIAPEKEQLRLELMYHARPAAFGLPAAVVEPLPEQLLIVDDAT